MKTFIYTLLESCKIKSIKAFDWEHAEKRIKLLHKTDSFTIDMQIGVKNWH